MPGDNAGSRRSCTTDANPRWSRPPDETYMRWVHRGTPQLAPKEDRSSAVVVMEPVLLPPRAPEEIEHHARTMDRRGQE